MRSFSNIPPQNVPPHSRPDLAAGRWLRVPSAALASVVGILLLARAAQAASQEAPPAGSKPGTSDAPPASAPAAGEAPKAAETPAAPEDLLRGPKVPALDVKSDRPYVEGAKDGEKLSKPVLEQRAYFRTIDLLALDAPTKDKVDALRVAFVDRVAEYQKNAQKRRMELEAKRKLANPAEPPSEEFKREMNAIEAARPKLAELQTQVNAAIGADRARELDKKFADELKRIREEQTRRTDEERKRRRAEIEEAKKAREAGGSAPAGGSDGEMGDEMAPSAPKSPKSPKSPKD